MARILVIEHDHWAGPVVLFPGSPLTAKSQKKAIR
jgi:hypothetical protein